MLCLFGVHLCVCEGAKYLVGQILCYCCHGSHVNDMHTKYIHRLHYLLLAAVLANRYVMWLQSPTDMLCGYCPQQICYVATVLNRYVMWLQSPQSHPSSDCFVHFQHTGGFFLILMQCFSGLKISVPGWRQISSK